MNIAKCPNENYEGTLFFRRNKTKFHDLHLKSTRGITHNSIFVEKFSLNFTRAFRKNSHGFVLSFAYFCNNADCFFSFGWFDPTKFKYAFYFLSKTFYNPVKKSRFSKCFFWLNNEKNTFKWGILERNVCMISIYTPNFVLRPWLIEL